MKVKRIEKVEEKEHMHLNELEFLYYSKKFKIKKGIPYFFFVTLFTVKRVRSFPRVKPC